MNMKKNYFLTVAMALFAVVPAFADGEVDKPVYNETTQIGYDTFDDAFKAIPDGETSANPTVLIITGSVDITTRYMIENADGGKKNLIIKGKDASAALVNKTTNANHQMFVMKGHYKLAFENIVLNGNNISRAKALVEAADGELNMKNVNITNYNPTAVGLFDIKSSAWGVFENVTSDVEGDFNYIGLNRNSSTFKGVNNVDIRLADGIFIVADNVADGNKINITMANPAVDTKVVQGCTNPAYFTLKHQGYKLEAKEGNLVVATDATVEIPTAVTIEGKANVGYNTLAEAITAAADGDVILVNEDLTLPNDRNSRVTINKPITVKGGKAGVVIKNAYDGQAFIINGKAATIENLILDGNNSNGSNYISVENNGGALTLKNVKIQNYTFGKNDNANKLVHAKGTCLIHLNGVKVENINGPEGVGMVNINKEGCTINGDNNISIHLNGSYTLTVPDGGALTGGPVNVYVTDHAIDAPVIKGCTDPNAFNLMKTGNKLVAKDGNLVLAASENSAVNEIEGVDENAPVEYYNLQGMKVNGELTPGIYVRRQGGKTVKVLVK